MISVSTTPKLPVVITAAAVLALALLSGTKAAIADTPAPVPTPATAPSPTATPRIHGAVTAVSATSITVHNRKDDTDSTFVVTPSTKVKVDKEDSTIDKVTVGMRASIKSDDGKTADEINARAPKSASAAPASTTPAPAPTVPATPAPAP